MFATLLGGLPWPSTRDPAALDAAGSAADVAAVDAAVAQVVAAQEAAGLEPITDGRLRWRGFAGPVAGLDGIVMSGDGVPSLARSAPRWRASLTVDAWRFAAGLTSRAVKQALPGPYTLGRLLAGSAAGRHPGCSNQPSPDRAALTMALAIALRAEVVALAEAGCPLIEIEERQAQEIGEDTAERRLFRDAHLAMADGIEGIHLSLAIVGGSAHAAGIETILAAAYPSLAVDLVDGPDNWRLVRDVPGDRGIVAGAMSPRHPSDDGPELMLWAAGYAASSNGRGRHRVGLAIAGSLAGLSWELAERKLRRLGEAARLAAMPAAEAAAHLDPRAVDIRSAAAGRYVPPRRARRP